MKFLLLLDFVSLSNQLKMLRNNRLDLRLPVSAGQYGYANIMSYTVALPL
jgi:hypothetical protein